MSFIGADDYTIAKKTAAALLKAIGGKGEVIVLEGVRGTATAQDRLRGFKEALAEFPDVRLVASQPANYQRLQAMQVMENLLQANPNVAGVLAANDTMAIGAMDALSEAGSKALITGINGSKEAIDAIKSGKMLASGDYNGFVQGCVGAMIALRYLRHEEVPKQVTQPTVVITKDNLAPYDVPLDGRQCPSSGSGSEELSRANRGQRARGSGRRRPEPLMEARAPVACGIRQARPRWEGKRMLRADAKRNLLFHESSGSPALAQFRSAEKRLGPWNRAARD